VGSGHYAVGGKQLTVADRLSDLREKKQQLAVGSVQFAGGSKKALKYP